MIANKFEIGRMPLQPKSPEASSGNGSSTASQPPRASASTRPTPSSSSRSAPRALPQRLLKATSSISLLSTFLHRSLEKTMPIS